MHSIIFLVKKLLTVNKCYRMVLHDLISLNELMQVCLCFWGMCMYMHVNSHRKFLKNIKKTIDNDGTFKE